MQGFKTLIDLASKGVETVESSGNHTFNRISRRCFESLGCGNGVLKRDKPALKTGFLLSFIISYNRSKQSGFLFSSSELFHERNNQPNSSNKISLKISFLLHFEME